MVLIFFNKHQHHASEIAQCLLHHTVVKRLNESQSQSASHWLAFRNTRFSKCLSFSFVLLCDMISPAELNSLSTASICHTPVLRLNGYTYPQKFFSPLGSPTILVFPHQTRCQYSDRDSPNGGVECNGRVWKNHDFRPISGFISELMQDRAIVIMEG